ncbi:hypothetical protein ATANTOWER_021457 [Ataeniobius toweri]|uniref:Uncharacterized protein n=1 Tax=Ataeniobius toweri TaxID=208326 RepID=A0ABU7AZ02_9TELE|nr:hypothetical protein [Ataeniobius toweri]
MKNPKLIKRYRLDRTGIHPLNSQVLLNDSIQLRKNMTYGLLDDTLWLRRICREGDILERSENFSHPT